MIAPGTTTSTPLGCACGRTSTDQVPAPSPASETASRSDFETPPLFTFRSENESETGSVKSFGSLARRRRRCRSRRSAPAPRPCGPCRPRPARQSRRAPTSPGAPSSSDAAARAARPLPRRAARPCSSRRRRRRARRRSGASRRGSAPPGAPTSGFSRWPNAVRPPEEKLVTMPPRPVASSSGLRPIRTVARPPCSARYARSAAPSKSAIMPLGTANVTGIPFASPGRLSTTTMPSAAGRAHARCLERERAGAAPDERDRAGQRAGGKR